MATVDNKWFPLEQGSEWVYEDTAAGSTTTVTVEPSNLLLSGVRVTAVRTVTEAMQRRRRALRARR